MSLSLPPLDPDSWKTTSFLSVFPQDRLVVGKKGKLRFHHNRDEPKTLFTKVASFFTFDPLKTLPEIIHKKLHSAVEKQYGSIIAQITLNRLAQKTLNFGELIPVLNHSKALFEWQKKLELAQVDVKNISPAMLEKSMQCYEKAILAEPKKRNYQFFWNMIRDNSLSQEETLFKFILEKFFSPTGYTTDEKNNLTVEEVSEEAHNYLCGEIVDTRETISQFKAFDAEQGTLAVKKYLIMNKMQKLFKFGDIEFKTVIKLIIQGLENGARWIGAERINLCFLSAIAKVKQIAVEILEKILEFLPGLHGFGYEKLDLLKLDVIRLAGEECAKDLPENQDAMELLFPVFLNSMLSVEPEEIDLELCQQKLDRIITMWKGHFINGIVVQTEASLSEKELNAFSLGGGMCAGIAALHISQRLKNPQAPVNAKPIFPLLEPRRYAASGMTIYPFDLKKNLTGEMRFLHASYQFAHQFSPSFNEILPDAVTSKYKLAIHQKFPSKETHSKPYLDINNLVFELRKIAPAINAEKGQIWLGIRGGDGPPHVLALHLNEPYHLMDPGFGILEFDSMEDLLTNVPLYLKSGHPEYTQASLGQFNPL
jgi:hypothetical protein